MTSSNFTAVTRTENMVGKALSCHVVAGVALVICRFKDQFYALENRCSHALSTFEEGRLRGYSLICPKHGASFDIRNGAVQSLPAKLPVRSFPLRIVDGVIEVDVSGAG